MSHAKLRCEAAALVAAVLLVTAPAQAGRTSEALLGTSCALLNLVYGPVKLGYALFGGLVGGVAYGFSAGDADVAVPILDAALRGDYAITADHLRGERELEFIGRSEAHRAARAQTDTGEEEPPTSFPEEEW